MIIFEIEYNSLYPPERVPNVIVDRSSRSFVIYSNRKWVSQEYQQLFEKHTKKLFNQNIPTEVRLFQAH